MSCGRHASGELGRRSRSRGLGSGCSTAASLLTVGHAPSGAGGGSSKKQGELSNFFSKDLKEAKGVLLGEHLHFRERKEIEQGDVESLFSFLLAFDGAI